MNYYELPYDEFSKNSELNFTRVDNIHELNLRIARQAVNAIEKAGQENRRILIITPTGPLDYSYWAKLCNERQVSCKPLVTMNMDEYIDDTGDYIPVDHPMSFRNFLNRTLVENLESSLQPDPANLLFPDPKEPAGTTEIIESFGGADICFGGFGISGHFAFNDPPQNGEEVGDEEFCNSRTRCLTIPPVSQTQMCMGGSRGNWDILPARAVTLGMYELLMSRKIHLTFMRDWHAGVLRRALFGPVSPECPGSFMQRHTNVEVTLTELAANLPIINVAQGTGEES